MKETKYESEKKKKKEMVPKRQYKFNQNTVKYHIYSF